MRRTLHADAPAKLNLGLRVVGRRPDGYHLLESLFVPLDLCDRVEVTVESGEGGPGVELALERAGGGAAVGDVPAGERNLATRAARAFLAAAGRRAALRVRLDKRVPSGAGLGGGSSDAGTVLRLLDRLWPGALDPAALAETALSLGADVPFFLDPRPAIVRGIGERIEPVAGFPPLPFVLANPGVSLATARVYEAADAAGSALTLTGADPTMPPVEELLAGLRRRPGSLAESLQQILRARRSRSGEEGEEPPPDPPDEWCEAERLVAALLANDLEPAAERLCPAIGRLRERLRSLGAVAVGMSGSGATVFGVFPGGEAARRALADAELSPPAWGRVAWSRGSPEPGFAGASPNW